MPSSAAARHTSTGSPTGSAAATRSSSRVGAGSGASRSLKLCSIRSDKRRAVGQPEPARELGGRPATWQLQQGQRVAARLGHDPIAHALIERAGDHRREELVRIAVVQPADGELRQPFEDAARRSARARRRPAPPTPHRDGARRRPAPAPRPRRATARRPRCRRAVALPRPSDSRLKAARPTRNRSGASPSRKPNAVPSASRCGPGRRSRRSRNGAHSCCNPAYASSISDSTPAARAMVHPDAAASDTRAARSCRPRPPRAAPAPGSDRCARSPPAPPAPRTRCAGQAAADLKRQSTLPPSVGAASQRWQPRRRGPVTTGPGTPGGRPGCLPEATNRRGEHASWRHHDEDRSRSPHTPGGSHERHRTTDASRDANVGKVDMKLEVEVIPVSDVDRSKAVL